MKAERTVPEKDPFNYSAGIYLLMIFMSAWGAVVGYFGKLKRHGMAFRLLDMLVSILSAGFTGIIVFWLCEWGGLPMVATAAMVGIAGHMNSKALELIESVVVKHYGGGSDGHS